MDSSIIKMKLKPQKLKGSPKMTKQKTQMKENKEAQSSETDTERKRETERIQSLTEN